MNFEPQPHSATSERRPSSRRLAVAGRGTQGTKAADRTVQQKVIATSGQDAVPLLDEQAHGCM